MSNFQRDFVDFWRSDDEISCDDGGSSLITRSNEPSDPDSILVAGAAASENTVTHTTPHRLISPSVTRPQLDFIDYWPSEDNISRDGGSIALSNSPDNPDGDGKSQIGCRPESTGLPALQKVVPDVFTKEETTIAAPPRVPKLKASSSQAPHQFPMISLRKKYSLPPGAKHRLIKRQVDAKKRLLIDLLRIRRYPPIPTEALKIESVLSDLLLRSGVSANAHYSSSCVVHVFPLRMLCGLSAERKGIPEYTAAAAALTQLLTSRFPSRIKGASVLISDYASRPDQLSAEFEIEGVLSGIAKFTFLSALIVSVRVGFSLEI
jgi:hypothetical protein